ncbi:thioredoxin family protein [Aminobacter sp. AP02]|uniref:DUF1223 domain-containing protein n=1 Tax=Aminobacter sp. AP02 TaxID=2135737 RepID=UPI000D6C9ED4|nr:thioredoxin family protein [Aminobacter sp. AP02]PWK76148.1 hypothetical protein C8K44_102135 [Aminobacter sp. AP02]
MEFRRYFRLAAVALALVGLGRAADAEPTRPLGVIELFTSQGCNSCPPADELFAEFAARDDMVALAYHVTYWDYLGWQDKLGSTDNTERQYAYMRAFGSRSVYTPQAVINGRTHVNGAKREEVTAALDNLAKTGQGMNVALKVTDNGDTYTIDVGEAKGANEAAHVVVVHYQPPQVVDLQKGENKGRSVTYWNAVTDLHTAGMWHGKAQRFELPKSEVEKKGGCAVLLQAVGKDGLPGPILGAAVVRKPVTAL